MRSARPVGQGTGPYRPTLLGRAEEVISCLPRVATLLQLLTSGIGTTRTQADPVARPLSARADVSPPDGNSGCDPELT